MFDSCLAAKHVIYRDLQILANNKIDIFANCIFFVIIVSLFPLVYGPLPPEQNWLVPGIIWVGALLAVLLAQETSMRFDFQLGIYEQLVLSPYCLEILLIARVFANWLVCGLPLLVITPCLGFAFSLPVPSIIVLCSSLGIGTLVLCLFGNIGTALTFTLPKGGLLLALMVLPLYTPILVLGAGACILSLQGQSALGHLALLAAIAIGAYTILPFALAGLIRVSQS